MDFPCTPAVNCLDVRDLGSCLRPSTFDVVIDKGENILSVCGFGFLVGPPSHPWIRLASQPPWTA